MIEITRNSEYYYSQPNIPYTRRADVGMMYRSMMHLMDGFSATDLSNVVHRIYGTRLSIQLIGHWLKRFAKWGYVKHEKDASSRTSQSYYTCLGRYYVEFVDRNKAETPYF